MDPREFKKLDQNAGSDRRENPFKVLPPLPRAERRRSRPRSDRGLPGDDEIRSLATAYCEEQRKLWPELAANRRGHRNYSTTAASCSARRWSPKPCGLGILQVLPS